MREEDGPLVWHTCKICEANSLTKSIYELSKEMEHQTVKKQSNFNGIILYSGPILPLHFMPRHDLTPMSFSFMRIMFLGYLMLTILKIK